ncbi:MAG: response regulator [Nitrospinae bacterium]|nr:response regulator [Nitrospinota bacterium]
MSKNIMVVDDSFTTRKMLSFLLKGEGFNVVSAENGIDALEKLTFSDIDVIITDLNMPQMDGLELINSLKKNPDYKDIPVIMLTTACEDSDKQKGIEAGASLYLIKPISQDVLIKEVKKFLG